MFSLYYFLFLPFLLPVSAGLFIFYLMNMPVKSHRARWIEHVHARVFDSSAAAASPAQASATAASAARKRSERLLGELHAAVVVCGDIARSPRMQYHAVSLCDIFDEVHVVGSSMGNRCCDELERLKKEQHHDTSTSSSNSTTPETSPPLSSSLSPSSRQGRAVFYLVAEDEATKASSPLQQQQQQQQQKQSWVSRVIKRVFSLFGRYLSVIWAVCSANNRLAFVLCQTPPVLPTLPLVWLVVFAVNFRRALRFKWEHLLWKFFGGKMMPVPLPPIAVVFDVHNLGWTILRAEKRPRLFVFVYWVVEWLFVASGIFCSARITISEAMGAYLTSSSYFTGKANSAATVTVMPDAAPTFFRPSSRDELWREVFAHNPPKFEFGAFGNNVPAWFADREAARADNNNNSENNATKTTTRGVGAAAAASYDHELQNNTLFVAGSTSWTADDDYSIVVEALKITEAALQKFESENSGSTIPTQNSSRRKQLWLFVSGKGPSRSAFEDAVQAAGLACSRHITVTTGYFQSFAHYAVFLGAADCGLCMHCSSSGLDLPMKGVDMQGAGLPMCALKYEPALAEMISVEGGGAGWIFESAQELANVWLDLLLVNENNRTKSSSTKNPRLLLEEKRAVLRANRRFWNQSWTERMALPVVATQVLATN